MGQTQSQCCCAQDVPEQLDVIVASNPVLFERPKVLNDGSDTQPPQMPLPPPEMETGPCPPPAEVEIIAKPDFNGKWLLTEIDVAAAGDIEQMFMEMGANPAALTSAKNQNYGINTQRQDITQTGDKFVIAVPLGKGGSAMTFTVGAGNVGKKKGSELLVARDEWDGQVLKQSMKYRNGDGMALPATKRYLENGKMKIDAELKTGAIVTRIFTKQ